MGMLDRYKKSGGFVQLLTLIESFPPPKQEKFLQMIAEENGTWAKALRERVLTVERILAWPPSTLAEIVPTLSVNVLAIALHGLDTVNREKIMGGLPNSERRRIELEFDVVQPKPQDIVTTLAKLVESVRGMITEGYLHAENTDAFTLLTEKQEEELLHAFDKPAAPSVTSEPAKKAEPSRKLEAVEKEEHSDSHEAAKPDGKTAADVKAMQNLILALQRENKSLKGELKTARDKLETIRKIA